MNYKLVATGSMVDIVNTHGKYGTEAFDVLETKTNYVVASNVPAYQNQAKNLCRRLNSGGGFNGFTPAFFLERLEVSAEAE